MVHVKTVHTYDAVFCRYIDFVVSIRCMCLPESNHAAWTKTIKNDLMGKLIATVSCGISLFHNLAVLKLLKQINRNPQK